MHLRNAPLVHVLAQVVFAPVPAIAERIADIQKQFRSLGFVRFSEGVTHRVTVVESAQPTVVARRRWDFLDRDKTTGIVLSESDLVLHTTVYQDRAPFLGLLGEAVAFLRQAADVELVDRLGLRFIDLVRPDSGERFDQYVHPGLLGFPFDEAEIGATIHTAKTEGVASTAQGRLVVRSFLLPPGMVVPPDLAPTPLTYPASVFSTEPALSLDFDHFSEATFDFDSAAIIERMTALHEASHRAFQAAGTPYAFERWGPWEEV